MEDKIAKVFVLKFDEAQKLFVEAKFSESLKKYQILLKENPQHVSVLNNIGLIYEELKFKNAVA